MKVRRIFTGYKLEFRDPLGEKLRERARRYFGIDTGRIWVVKAYYVVKDIPDERIVEIAEKLFLDPASQAGL